ncbi:MAG: ABC transporter permease subunit [Candidatus Eisenbacteria bacterium]|nr:ABC transporter permease subunit [Candidatus Latescibacterota bacterium]MBD3303145.1 ABC transporter permease subunit [Candidatus Eisenbacteria bacterium]
MGSVAPIFKKEFLGYFQSPIAYIFLTVFLILMHGLLFWATGFLVIGQADLRDFFGLMSIVLVFFVPAISMRLWAEEMKLGTMELLMTFPVRDWEAVIGKYLAALAMIALAILLTIPLPITIGLFGNPDAGPIIGGYLGALLLSAAYLAIGAWTSSTTSNQIISFILGLLILLVASLGLDWIRQFSPGWLATWLAYFSLRTHFDSIARGVVDIRDVVFYLSVIGFFLYLNVRSVESRKWS